MTTTGYPSAGDHRDRHPAGRADLHRQRQRHRDPGRHRRPAGGGTYPLSLTANNGVSPNATQTLTVTVGQPPAFTSAATATFTVGTAGQLHGDHHAGVPTVSTITKTGTLPSGLTFTDNGNGTATLAGTPAAGTGGTYPLTLTATNGVSAERAPRP